MWILNLSLKKKWFQMIESGIKKEEYRELKPFWMRRIFDCPKGLSICVWNRQRCSSCIRLCPMSARSFSHVRFRNGYTKQTMTFEIIDINIGFGNPTWGAPKDKVIIIKIGKQCNIKQ